MRRRVASFEREPASALFILVEMRVQVRDDGRVVSCLFILGTMLLQRTASDGPAEGYRGPNVTDVRAVRLLPRISFFWATQRP